MNRIEIQPLGIVDRAGQVAYAIIFRDASSSFEAAFSEDELKILHVITSGAVLKVQDRKACDPVRDADNAGL